MAAPGGTAAAQGLAFMNPKDHLYGPTIAREKAVLIEIDNCPYYCGKPVFHTDETIGDFLAADN